MLLNNRTNKYEFINPQQFLKVLSENDLPVTYTNTLRRRFKKHNMNINTAIDVVYKAKGIDLRDKLDKLI